jgi:hypothetical protein
LKKLLCLLVAITLIFILGSCSLIGDKTTTPAPASTGYPDSVVYKIKLSSDTYLCSGFNVSNSDTEISLRLNDVYSVTSDGKITWLAKEKVISAATIEKLSK